LIPERYGVFGVPINQLKEIPINGETSLMTFNLSLDGLVKSQIPNGFVKSSRFKSNIPFSGGRVLTRGPAHPPCTLCLKP